MDWYLEVKIQARDEQTRREIVSGGKVVRQSQGEVARQPKFFQPTQDVIGVQDERKTSRSQEMDECELFNEELCSSDRSGRPGITQDVISVQACSSEDSKSLNNVQIYARAGRLGKDTVPAQDDPEVYREA